MVTSFKELSANNLGGEAKVQNRQLKYIASNHQTRKHREGSKGVVKYSEDDREKTKDGLTSESHNFPALSKLIIMGEINEVTSLFPPS